MERNNVRVVLGMARIAKSSAIHQQAAREAFAMRTPSDSALKAAAPDLYEALRKLLRHEHMLGGGCSVSADIAQARAALAKAEGRG